MAARPEITSQHSSAGIRTVAASFGKKRRVLRNTFVFFLFFLMVLQSSAWGAIKDFAPQYVDLLGSFSVNSLYEKNRIKAKRADTSRTDLTIQEGLNLTGLGYIYSPLFVVLNTSVTLGLEQERTDHNGQKYSALSDATQFKQQFKILPSHPYNMDIYFSRRTPMTPGGGADGNSLVIYEHGAEAIYDQRPWATKLTYTNLESNGDFNSENETLRYNLHYFQTTTNISGTIGQIRSSMSEGDSMTTRNFYNLNLNKRLEKISFTSRWDSEKQQGEDNLRTNVADTLAYERENSSFYSGLDIDLPKKFDTLLSYRNMKRNSRTIRASGENTSDTTTNDYNFQLHHRLYKSLNTSFSAGRIETESTGGELQQNNYRLSLAYTKKIPWGSVYTGLSNGLSLIENRGATTTLLQSNTTDINGRIDLVYQNIDPDTIEISVVDPDPINNGRLIVLEEFTHYTVTTFNTNFYRITINSIQPASLSNHPDGNIYPDAYSFQILFSFIPSEYDLATQNLGYNLKFSLFNNLISPQYSYLQSDQKVTAGIFPGEPNHSKFHTLGVGFNKSPFGGRIAYSWLRSNTTSEDKLATSLDYKKTITPFTSGYFSCSFEDVQTKQHNTDSASSENSLSEQFYIGQMQLQTIIPEKNLTASLTNSYSLYKGSGESVSVSLYGNLVWRVGRLDLSLTGSFTDSTSTIGGNTSNRQYTVIKFALTRELF